MLIRNEEKCVNEKKEMPTTDSFNNKFRLRFNYLVKASDYVNGLDR